jgi:acetyl coenzyme A synthetase (ADP forming)-like protein
MPENTTRLDPLFTPQSIAVIGASDKTNRIGYQVVKSLVEGGFKGTIYPVNPRLTTLFNLEAFSSITSIPGDVDLAIIVLRKDRVLEAVDACGRKCVQSLIVMSSGFSELGNTQIEDELLQCVRKYGMRMLGPNCAGFASTSDDIYASFENRLQAGNIAFISQSGAMCAVVLALARAESLGLSMFVSYGNAADLGPAEILEYLRQHKPTELIGYYLEGTKHARTFLNAARVINVEKPIVILKPGETPAAAKAIQSHTGALAGEQAIYTGAFRQAGIHQAKSLEEFIDACNILASQPLPNGKRVGIITNSGGPGVLAVDACAQNGLDVVSFHSSLIEKFQTFLPPVCPVFNPVDLGPEGDAKTYQKVTEILLSQAQIDIVFVLCAPPVFSDIRAISKAIVTAKTANLKKPLITCWLAGDIVREGIPILNAAQIPNFPIPQRAAKAIKFLVDRATWLRTRHTN